MLLHLALSSTHFMDFHVQPPLAEVCDHECILMAFYPKLSTLGRADRRSLQPELNSHDYHAADLFICHACESFIALTGEFPSPISTPKLQEKQREARPDF